MFELVYVVLVFLMVGFMSMLFMAKRARSAAQKAATAKLVAMNKAKRGGSKSKSKKSRRDVFATFGGNSSGSKPVFKLASILQAVYITQAATGNRLDDIVQLLFAYFSNVVAGNTASDSANRMLLVQIIGIVQSAIMAVINNPSGTAINVGISVAVTAGARKLAAMVGIPKYVDCGKFVIEVR